MLVCMYVCIARRGHFVPETGVGDGCEAPCRCWELNLDPFSELSLQLPKMATYKEENNVLQDAAARGSPTLNPDLFSTLPLPYAGRGLWGVSLPLSCDINLRQLLVN